MGQRLIVILTVAHADGVVLRLCVRDTVPLPEKEALPENDEDEVELALKDPLPVCDTVEQGESLKVPLPVSDTVEQVEAV